MTELVQNEKIKEICRHFEETAEMIGMQLSINVESIKCIEDILTGLKEFGDEGALSGAAYMAGVYLGEIIRSKTNGKWVFDSSLNQEAININETFIYPIIKTKEYAANNEDSLVFYAQAILAKYNG